MPDRGGGRYVGILFVQKGTRRGRRSREPLEPSTSAAPRKGLSPAPPPSPKLTLERPRVTSAPGRRQWPVLSCNECTRASGNRFRPV